MSDMAAGKVVISRPVSLSELGYLGFQDFKISPCFLFDLFFRILRLILMFEPDCMVLICGVNWCNNAVQRNNT